jgi:hypothetical protein
VLDYWIMNLVDRVLEVHREPARPGQVAVIGALGLNIARRAWGYAAIDSLGADRTVSPLAAPAARISVADLLP